VAADEPEVSAGVEVSWRLL